MPDNADLIAWLRDERRLCPPSEWLRATDAAAAALEAADERIAALNERHAAFVKLNTAMFDNVARERDTARERIAALEKDADAMREALLRIVQWADAYPEDVFPAVTKDEWKQANVVLDAAGLSLTRISASNMRHVVEGVGKIARMAAPLDAARAALKEGK